MRANIDVIPMEKSLIDLSQVAKNSFDSTFLGFDLSQILDDVILAEFVDETENGEMMRGSLVISTNASTNAWRVGRAILVGPNVKMIKKDDYIIFPNNLGIPISNIDVENYGKLKKGIFINEQRIFGKAIPRKEENTIANNVTQSKKSSSSKRL